MTKIESSEHARPSALSEVAVAKNRCTSTTTTLGRALIVLFFVSLIITVSLLLVAFLTPGLSYSVYLPVLISAGCIAKVGLGALVSVLFLRCLLGKGKKEISPQREGVNT